MSDTFIYSVIIVAVIAVLTYAQRLFPYLLFGRGREVPEIAVYLGKTLPPAIMMLLIVFCLRNVDFMSGNHGLPEIAAIAAGFILYKLTKNNLIAMALGTVLYMFLI
jgi:branched-subunit amino acid transport protein AzlD